MPTIYSAREREATSIPIAEVFRDGDIDIIRDVQSRDYFDITFRGDRLTVTAGKYVGLIPLNDRVFIRVEPKVPIGNLLAVLSAVEGEVVELPMLSRQYRETDAAPPAHLLASIASIFVLALRRIEVGGLQKNYDPFTMGGTLLKGQISFSESVQQYWSRGIGYAAVSTFFDLTADIAQNQLLRYACHVLLVHHRRTDLLRDTIRDLAHFEDVFSRAGVHLTPVGTGESPHSAEHSADYVRALRLARLIVAGHGVELRGDGEDISLPSFVINMEALFEDYVRHVMATQLNGVEVLNGNTDGSRPLFDNSSAPKATPDIVVRRGPAYPLIGEVKYKSQDKREDRYQVLAYGLSYRARNVVLVLPADSAASAGLASVGEIDSLRVHRYRFDLSATNLAAEEARFGAAVRELLQPSA